ncbi:unnamed protein product [Onchocerca ochengi]|uniref:Kelch repeat protein n=1 Tax=Onchocerca ochengi TaxID=42157 RepID=A0A182EPB7_ONCOC|nr:unnamed protein product [Onchocerca ochengi]
MACWIVALEGGPEGANHASVAIGHCIYAFGSCVCSGDSSTGESDESDESDEYNESFGVHVLNTTDYRWSRVITRIFESQESVDESERSFQPYGEIPTFREGHTVVAYDGMVYMWGGYCVETRTLCSKMYCFDPENKTWSVIPSRSETPPGRVRHTAVVYKNMMLIHGGQNDIQTT